MVLGLLIGRVVGQYFGWRTSFAIGIAHYTTLLCLTVSTEIAERAFRSLKVTFAIPDARR